MLAVCPALPLTYTHTACSVTNTGATRHHAAQARWGQQIAIRVGKRFAFFDAGSVSSQPLCCVLARNDSVSVGDTLTCFNNRGGLE